MRLLQFAEIFPLQLPTVIHHLRVLEECGLLHSWKQGPMRLYRLRPEGLKEAEAWLRRTYETALDRRPEVRRVARRVSNPR